MNDMIELVARALAKQDAIEHELTEPMDWQLYRQSARTAIEAMRKPNDAILRAGEEAYNREELKLGNDPIDVVSLLDAWEAMIDEILK